MVALPDLPAGISGRALWEFMGWFQPGHPGTGRVDKYVPDIGAGFIRMDDRGPDVHFKPDHLDSTLMDLLRAEDLIHTRVRVTVLYRPNGRSRYTEGVIFVPEDEDDQSQGGGGAA